MKPKHTGELGTIAANKRYQDFSRMRELNKEEAALFADDIAVMKRRGLHPVLIEKNIIYVPYLTTDNPKVKLTNADIDRAIAWWEAQRPAQKARR